MNKGNRAYSAAICRNMQKSSKFSKRDVLETLKNNDMNSQILNPEKAHFNENSIGLNLFGKRVKS